MPQMLKFEHPKEQSNIIKVIGVGGGGSNAVTHMYHQGIKGVDFVLCNTDAQALEISPVPNKIHLGKRQLGAGNMPAVGREAAIETITEIKELLEPHTKMLFITAGMGGGTGTGAAPVVAQVARELDILTVGIVTLPFSFEGKKRRQQAIEGIEELRKYVDTLLIISNDKLREEYGNMRLTEAFKKADDVLTTASKGIAEIITVTGYINVDFEDVRTVMQNSGKAIMGSAKAEGENRALKAIEDAMRSPLLNDSNIVGAKNILLYITSGEIEISLDEVHEITDYIQHICGNTAEVIWGNGVDESLGNNIAISVIATGFDNEENLVLTPGNTTTKVTHLYGPQETAPKVATEKGAVRTPVKVHTLVDEAPEEQITESKTTATAINTINQNAAIVHQLFDQLETSEADSPAIEEANEVEASTPEITVFKKSNVEADDIFLEITNPQDLHQPIPKPVSFSLHTSQSNDDGDKLEMERKSLERQARLKALSLKIKTNEGLEELERQPAYMRKGTDIKFQDDEQDLSRYSINNDPMRPGLRSDNSFLHDNVD